MKDLPPRTVADEVFRWIDRDPEFDNIKTDIRDINCHGGAHSGAVMAFVTFEHSWAAKEFFTTAYKWYAYCPYEIDSRGWRMCGIRYARIQ